MSANKPWLDDPDAGNAWDEDPDFDAVSPPKTKSEAVGRGLKNFSLHSFYEGPLGVVDATGSILSNLAGEAVSGLAGIAGGVAGGVKSGLDAGLEGIGLMDEDTWQPDGVMDTAANWQKGTSQAVGWDPVSKAGEDIAEVVGSGMEKGVQGAKHIGAGYSGLANLALGDPEIAAMSVEEFLQTPDALAEGVFEATGNPTLAAVTRLLPDLATVAAPGAKTTKIKPKPSMAPDMSPGGMADMPGGYGGVGVADDIPAPGRPVPESGFEASPNITMAEFDEIQAALQSGDKARLFELMEANPKYVQAFEALGIEFTPGMVAENAALRQVQSNMKSVPGSQLGTYDDAARLRLQEKADELINRQGSTNRMAVDAGMDAELKRLRESFLEHEEGLWKQLNDEIPRGSPIDLRSAADGVMQRVVEAGRNGNVEDGLRSVSRHDQELFRMTHQKVPVERKRLHEGKEITEVVDEWQYTEPKYAAVDYYRKKLGRGMDGRDDFGGADAGELDFLYGQMAEAQGRVAKGRGYNDLWEDMNKTTVKRKELEAATKRLQGSAAGVIGKVAQASSNLRKGIAGPLRQLMEDTPQSQRAAIASAVMEDMFYPAAIKTGDLKPNFVASYKALKRNPEAMDLIFDNLDEVTKADFMIVGDAATGFFRSLLKDNTSNTAGANAVIKQLEEGGSVMKLLGIARSGAQRIPAVGSTVAREGAEGIRAAMKGRARKAAEFLQSQELRDAVREYAAGRMEVATEILNDGRAYREWFKYLSEAEKQQIAAAGGVVGWLASEETEE